VATTWQQARNTYVDTPRPGERQPAAAEEAHDKRYENCMFCRELRRQCYAGGDVDCQSDFRHCIATTPWSAKHCD
jgi:hypothetical protein